jgi:predicted membrane-bound spermidine synthase
MRPSDQWVASAVVFIASFCTLVIELIAARIMAPYVGVSLYTWTSIIGVCLAGIAAGSYVGGRVADRATSVVTVGILLALSGASALAILPIIDWVVAQHPVRDWPLMARILVQTSLVFFAPTFLLGTISPVVIRLSLADLARSGATVGRLYAVSTLGAIAGTFATGFYLVEALGTRAIVWAVAIVLVALGLLVGRAWRSRRGALAAAVVLAALSFAFGHRDGFRAPCVDESSYYCIALLDQEVEGRPVRSLALDHLVHSYVDPDDPTFIGYGYERVYAELTELHMRDRTEFATLSIGGGGYTFPRYLAALHPEMQVDVLEIDPAVTRAAYDLLGLSLEARIRTFNTDARVWFMEHQPEGRYDVVYGDAYNDLSVPYHLTTVEFDRMVRRALKPDGVLMANVIDNYRTGEFLRAYMRTLAEVFEHVDLFALGPRWEGEGAATYVVLASAAPFDVAAFGALERPGVGDEKVTAMLEPEILRGYLARGRRIVLTDDYAPVDNLVAPIFIERETW